MADVRQKFNMFLDEECREIVGRYMDEFGVGSTQQALRGIILEHGAATPVDGVRRAAYYAAYNEVRNFIVRHVMESLAGAQKILGASVGGQQ